MIPARHGKNVKKFWKSHKTAENQVIKSCCLKAEGSWEK